MADNKSNGLKKGVGLHARRVIAYIVLIIITFFCLFWFYILFINATRSNGELQSGFQAFPSTHFMDNWKNLVKGTLPIWNGLFNSLIIATFSAILCVYFSTGSSVLETVQQVRGTQPLPDVSVKNPQIFLRPSLRGTFLSAKRK